MTLGHLALLAEELRLRRADRLLVGERLDHGEELVPEPLELRDQIARAHVFLTGTRKNKNGGPCEAAVVNQKTATRYALAIA